MVSGGCLNMNRAGGVTACCEVSHCPVTGPCLWHCQSRLDLSCRISVAAREAVLDCFADANGMFQVFFLLRTYSFDFICINDIQPESRQKAILHTTGAFLRMSVDDRGPGGTPKYQPIRWLSANNFWCENIQRYRGLENTWLVSRLAASMSRTRAIWIWHNMIYIYNVVYPCHAFNMIIIRLRILA